MWFPLLLSPSPVHEVFSEIRIDNLSSLDLSAPEKALFKSGEQNVIEYTLFDHNDATDYVHLLLKLIERLSSSTAPASPSSRTRVCALGLDHFLSHEKALDYLCSDEVGVAYHYTISTLCEVFYSLRENSKSTKATIANIFYPDGMLIEQWRSLWKALRRGTTDDYAQRKLPIM
jgi:hypothetical protein